MLEQLKSQFAAHKAQIIKFGAAAAGAFVGVAVAAALTSEDESWMVEEPYEDTPELPEEAE